MKKQRQGYRFKCEPKYKHRQHLVQSLGANRFVWNKLLAMNLRRLRNKQPIMWFNEMDWWIKFWKQSDEFSFLSDAPSQSLQQTAKALGQAFKDAFDPTQPNKRIPVFKKLGKNEAGIRYPQGFSLDQGNSVVKVPKVGWLKYRNSRDVKGVVKNVTISRKGGDFFVSIQTESEASEVVHPSSTAAGVDLGITHFATLSTGEQIDPVNSFKQLSQKLAHAQRKLSRMVKFSANWKQQRTKIAKIHRRIAYVRANFLHQTSSYISKNHAMIVLEDLKVKNMSKSSKGTLEQPGKKVAQKRGLNRSIRDQGWGEFRRQLEYKQAWLNGITVIVPAQYTSQTCHACGHVDKDNRKTQSEFACTACGHKDNADVNAAKNILAKGHHLLSLEGKENNRGTHGAGLSSEARKCSAAGTSLVQPEKA
jgi:putative transposase